MSNEPKDQTPATSTVDWPGAHLTDIPRGAKVVLGFHGLLCFYHRHNHSDKHAEIGVHSRAWNHNLSITVYRVSPDFDPPYNMDMGISPGARPYAGPYTVGDAGSTKDDKVIIDVDRPLVFGPQDTDVMYFRRGAPQDHEHNFTRILDLESDDFYGKGVSLPKRSEHLAPRLRVSHGVFYTLCSSRTKFDRIVRESEGPARPQGPARPLGEIARMTGANIYLDAGGSVELKMKGSTKVELKESDAGKFFVFIDNGCPTSTANDFPLYDHVYDPPASNPVRFDLVKTSSGGGTVPPTSPCSFLETFKKSTDDAPCGAAAFGSSVDV